MAFEHEVQHLFSAEPMLSWAQVMQQGGKGGGGVSRGVIYITAEHGVYALH